MKRILILALAILLVLGMTSCAPKEPMEYVEKMPVREVLPVHEERYLPYHGQVHLFIGQDLASIGGLRGYNNGYIDYFGMPAGITTYTDIASMTGLDTPANWGAGDIHARAYLDNIDFDSTMLSIGLQMVGDLTATTAGDYDLRLDQLAAYITEYDDPVFVRIAYAFNKTTNNYNDTSAYISAYRYVCDYLDDADVTNYVSVWQADELCTSDEILSYYPGDEYVDWCGYSYYDADASSIGADMLAFAREHDRPVFICEATPREDLMIADSHLIWDTWYTDFLDHIRDNSDVISAVSYTNCRWRTQPMWIDQDWGDSRLQVNPYIAVRWLETLNDGLFATGSITEDVPLYMPTPMDVYPPMDQ